MDIRLTPISFNNKKDYVSSIYKAMFKLMEGEDITIKISHKIDFKDLAEALDNIEDIVAAAATAMRKKDIEEESPDQEDSENDPADWWKGD